MEVGHQLKMRERGPNNLVGKTRRWPLIEDERMSPEQSGGKPGSGHHKDVRERGWNKLEEILGGDQHKTDGIV